MVFQAALEVGVYLPPPGPFDAARPLDSLPQEVAEAADLEVLQGRRVPADYLQRGPIELSPPPGRIHPVPDSQLLFS